MQKDKQLLKEQINKRLEELDKIPLMTKERMLEYSSLILQLEELIK